MNRLPHTVTNSFLFFVHTQIFHHPVSFHSIVSGSQLATQVMAPIHTFQLTSKYGHALSLEATASDDLDLNGFVPITGSSRSGYMSFIKENGEMGQQHNSINYIKVSA